MIKRRVILTTTGVAALSVVLFAGAASAAQGPGDGTRDCTAQASQTRASTGWGRMDSGNVDHGREARGRSGATGPVGSGTHLAYPSGELTDAQKADLLYMVQEEKLAFDLYTAFDAQYDDAVLARVATSETRHLAAVRTLLTTYGLDDPTEGLAAGEFADPDLASTYDDLIAQGMTSLEQAYAVGRTVELDDLEALAEASTGVTAPDVSHVYKRLVAAGEKHLDAFGG